MQNEELRLELDGLRSLVRLKNRELSTIKRLAAVILKQRTEVEAFFLEALSEVKAEVAARKKAAAAAALAAARTPLDRSGVQVALSPMRPAGLSAAGLSATTGSSFSVGAGPKLRNLAPSPSPSTAAGRGAPGFTAAGVSSPARVAAITLSLPEGAASLPPGTTLPALVQHGHSRAHHAGAASPSATATHPPLYTPHKPPLRPDAARATQCFPSAADGGAVPRGHGAIGATGAGHPPMQAAAASQYSTDGSTAGSGAPLTATQRQEASQIDIAQLGPEDRLKVLRLLFAKIHHVGSLRRPLPPPGSRDKSPPPPPPRSVTPGRSRPEPAPPGTPAGAQTTVSAPFGLSADIPDSLREMIYSARSTAAPSSSSIERADTGVPGSNAWTRAAGAASGTSGVLQTRLQPAPATSASSASREPASALRSDSAAAGPAWPSRPQTNPPQHARASRGRGNDTESQPAAALGPEGSIPSDLDAESEARIREYLAAEGADLLGLTRETMGDGDEGSALDAFDARLGMFGSVGGQGSAGDRADGADDTEQLADSLIAAVTERETISRRLATDR